jgi:hypothetical protein
LIHWIQTSQFTVRTPVREYFEAMMEKGKDKIPVDGFLLTKMPMYFIVTVDKILLCLGVLLLQRTVYDP